jgi:hypothetical protein
MELVLIIIVIISSFVIRVMPRCFLPNAITHDTYYHLLWADEIEKNNYRLPQYHKRSYFKEKYTYPFLYHWVLALFNKKNRLLFEKFSSALFDTLNIILFYFSSKIIVSTLGFSNELLFQITIFSTTLLAFSPMLLRLGYGPRAYNGSPRVFGQLLYNSHILCTFFAIENHSYILGLLAIIFCSTQFITSKFSLQVLVFFSIFFITFFGTTYLIIWVCGLLFAIIYTNGRVLNMIKAQVLNMGFYFRVLQKRFLYGNVNFDRKFKDYFLLLKHHIKMQFLRKEKFSKFYNWFYDEPYFLHILFTCLPFAAIFIFLIPLNHINNPSFNFIVIWAFAGFAWFLITKIKFFLFIGEAERYIEYAIYPIIFGSIVMLFETFKSTYSQFILLVLLLIFVAYSIVSAIYYVTEYKRTYKVVHDQYFTSKSILEQLNTFESGVVLPISEFWQSVYFCKFPSITLMHGYDGKLITEKVFLDIFYKYPFPSPKLNYLVSEYNVKYIFGGTSSVDTYIKMIEESNESFSFTQILVNEHFVVYKLI